MLTVQQVAAKRESLMQQSNDELQAFCNWFVKLHSGLESNFTAKLSRLDVKSCDIVETQLLFWHQFDCQKCDSVSAEKAQNMLSSKIRYSLFN